MDKLTKPGRIIFAIGIIALGILCFIFKDFIVGRPPAWPAGFEVNPALGYISGVVLIIAALAIILNIKGRLAALLIAALIFLLSILRYLPHFMNDWLNGYKSMALLGGALIIASSFYNEDSSNPELRRNESLRKGFTVTGCILLAVFFIACGYAHFN